MHFYFIVGASFFTTRTVPRFTSCKIKVVGLNCALLPSVAFPQAANLLTLKLEGDQLKPFAVITLLICACAVASHAQLPLGTVSNVTQETCPPDDANIGWVAATNDGPPVTTCYTATVSCPNMPNIQMTYGVATPSVPSNGTIVFISAQGGTSLVGGNFATSVPYQLYHANFQTVQMEWASDWRDGSTGNGYFKEAACREGTALSFFNTTFYQTANNTPTAGTCAIGWSGGAAGLGYALTYYGADFLDKAMFVSGPHYGNLVDGCVPSSAPITVCPTADGVNYPMGCGTLSGSWTEAGQYEGQRARVLSSQIGNDPPCNVPTHVYTEKALAALTADSLVDQASDSNFTYPQTAVSAYLCDDDETWGNPSETQGWEYYSQIASPSQVASGCNYANTADPQACLAINRVYGCQHAEETFTGYVCLGSSCPVCTGNPPSCTCNGVACSGSYGAQTAQIAEMEDPVNGCVAHHSVPAAPAKTPGRE